MPKRKRVRYGREELDPAQEIEYKKREVEKKLVHGKKLLNRALKTARGFERQKLGKRIKLVTEAQGELDVERLQRELDSLKTLDFAVTVESHLYKTLLKSKDIQESGLLPAYVKSGVSWDESTPEALAAIANVTARLYNTKPVKDTMSQIMESIYTALGIGNPSNTSKIKTIESKHSNNTVKGLAISSETKLEGDVANPGRATLGTSGISTQLPILETGPDHEPDSMSDLHSEPEPEPVVDLNSAYDSDKIFDMQVVGSSDEGGNDDVGTDIRNEPVNSVSGIPEKQQDSLSMPSQYSLSPSPPPRSKKSAEQVQQISNKKDSTFLPTLMGGYWSGSESATDEEEAPKQRKNRPGQQARRALWERKYGKSANHLKDQVSRTNRDKDWDPKRGARSADDSRFRQARGGGAPFMKSKGEASGENAIAVKSRTRELGKRDDTGPIHPSWEAAKKAKEAKRTAAFQGKKIVFG